MIGRVPRHTSLGDGIDPNGLFVFIPGAIASGFLISLGLLAGDAYRGVRGDSGNQRRIRNGLRRSAVYGVVGLASFGLVTLGIPGATWNFFNPVGYISDIGWIWALSLLLIGGFAVLGVQTLRLAPRWHSITVVFLGLGIAARFAVGNESGPLRAGLIVLGVVVVAAGAGFAWRARAIRRGVDVPPSVRPLLARTPLARPE